MMAACTHNRKIAESRKTTKQHREGIAYGVEYFL